jgi:hypothetical protein
MKPFFTSAPESPKWDGGYAGGTLNPTKIADEVFREEISGPWLTCYMLRRFGWPNEGSDDYKNLMSWCLTTPIEGLYLSVTPYLGGSNLHFGVLFTKEVEKKIEYDRGLESFFKRQRAELLRWWNREGKKKYTIGGAKPNDPKETLLEEYCTDKGKVWGIYERKPHHKGTLNLHRQFKKTPMMQWFIGNFCTKKLGHKEMKRTKWEMVQRGNPFQKQCVTALHRTMLDLLRTTNIRDLDFNIFGRPETTYAKKPKQKVEPAAKYWPGVGNTPEYWYSAAAKKEREKARKQ